MPLDLRNVTPQNTRTATPTEFANYLTKRMQNETSIPIARLGAVFRKADWPTAVQEKWTRVRYDENPSSIVRTVTLPLSRSVTCSQNIIGL